jgi:integrase
MGIKYDRNTKTYKVTYSLRHPITRVPYGMRRKNIQTMARAKRVHAEMICQVQEKVKRRTIPSWEEFLNLYFEDLHSSELSKSTILNFINQLECHTKQAWMGKCIDEIRSSDVFSILKDKHSGNSEAHKKYFLKVVRRAFEFAIQRGFIEKNPTPVMKFKVRDKIQTVLSEDQISILMRKGFELGWEWAPHYTVAVMTGMRSGELYALTWEKVNLEKRQILVNCSWSSKGGFKSTKSGDDRIVEIPMPLIPVLQDLKLKTQMTDFVLPRLSRWDKGEQARELRLFLVSIGLPPVRFHDLRASWATMLLSRGVSPTQVMAMGGWKDLKTMMIYVRKAGINIKGSTSVIDHLQATGFQEAKVLEFGKS